MATKFQHMYVKYIIKSPVIFLSFLIVGIFLLSFISVNLKLNIMKQVEVEVTGSKVLFDDTYQTVSNTVYLYSDRNEEIFKFEAEELSEENGNTVMIINNEANLSGKMNAEIVVGTQTLFEKILVNIG